MSNKKHIDRIFQESFKDFEAKPNPDLWSKIQNEMALETEKPKTAFPIWMRVASVAAVLAVLAVLITVGSFVFTESNNPVSSDEKIVNTETSTDGNLLNSDKSNANSEDNSVTKNGLKTTNPSTNKTASNEETSKFENETIANTKIDANGNPIAGENSGRNSNTNSDSQNNTTVTSKTNTAVANTENNRSNFNKQPNSNYSTNSNKINTENNNINKTSIANQDKTSSGNLTNTSNNALSNTAVQSTSNVATQTSENAVNSDENSINKTGVTLNNSINKNGIASQVKTNSGNQTNNTEHVISNTAVESANHFAVQTTEDGLHSDKNSENQIGVASNNSINQASSTDKTDAIAANETLENSIDKSTIEKNNDNNNNTVASTINSANEVNKTASDVQRAVSTSETDNLLKDRSSQDAIAWNAKSSNTPQNEKEKEENLMVGDSLVSESPSIEDAIAQAEDITEKDEEEKLVNRWQVQANIAPVYYNSLGKGSHIDEEFVSNSKSGETNTSYGVNVSYAISKKFAIRSGISSLNLSYDTDNVILYNSPSTNNPGNTNPLRNINLAPESQTLSAFSGDNLGFQQINNELYNAAISQRLSYYEVPVELEYKLVNNRFGVNIIGGMSTFFLNDNEVYSEFEEYKTYIGEANNVNSVSFSTNLGIGLNYKFTDKLLFNFEPTFKYQLNGFDNTSGNFKPYIIGVYTGFSYKF